MLADQFCRSHSSLRIFSSQIDSIRCDAPIADERAGNLHGSLFSFLLLTCVFLVLTIFEQEGDWFFPSGQPAAINAPTSRPEFGAGWLAGRQREWNTSQEVCFSRAHSVAHFGALNLISLECCSRARAQSVCFDRQRIKLNLSNQTNCCVLSGQPTTGRRLASTIEFTTTAWIGASKRPFRNFLHLLAWPASRLGECKSHTGRRRSQPD